MSNKGLPDINTDFSAWYNEVITQAGVIDASPTKGCVVLRPYGYAIWENIKEELDRRIKERDVENAYFPLLIPESFLKKEAEHVEGFAPELAVVTHAGGKKLEEPYVVRPTSETMVYHIFSRWISSWRDLPLKINQWANVVRWEMRTRPFLRTSEFLWQEGHTAHATREEADEFARTMLSEYIALIEESLCIPLFVGRKSAKERFAGADDTYCMEAMMPDGKALQMGTSHLLAHSFPAAYGVQFQDKDGQLQTPWCTSWGMTTRLVGAAIMVHGDQQGLVMPPMVAPHQVVIIPIYRKEEEKEAVLAKAEELQQELHESGFRVKIDASDDRPGSKFFKWEQRGVPVRLELGPRDVEANTVMLAKRVREEDEERKAAVSCDDIITTVFNALEAVHITLTQRARQLIDDKLCDVQEETVEAFGPVLAEKNGFFVGAWCGESACEEKLTAYKAGIRCVMDVEVAEEARCFGCETVPADVVIVAKGY